MSLDLEQLLGKRDKQEFSETTNFCAEVSMKIPIFKGCKMFESFVVCMHRKERFNAIY